MSAAYELNAIASRLENAGALRAATDLRRLVDVIKTDCEQLQNSAYTELSKPQSQGRTNISVEPI